MATDKYLNLQGLAEVANKVNQKLKTVTTMPLNPQVNDTVLYKGATTEDYTQGSIYVYRLKNTYYAWKNLTDIYYTLSATPEEGDVVYSDATGTESGYPVEEYDDTNNQILVNNVIYNRDTVDDTDFYSWQSTNTSIVLNGEDKTGEVAEFYAPTSSGQEGQLLQSQGADKAPIWTPFNGYSPSFVEDSLIFVYGVIPEVDDTTLIFNL